MTAQGESTPLKKKIVIVADLVDTPNGGIIQMGP